jgi:hypothetical protein
MAAIKVFDQGGHPLTKELLQKFLDYAYAYTPTGNILDPDVLLQEIDTWVVGIDDVDGVTIQWFSGIVTTPFGKKFVVSAAGPDAGKTHKAEMLGYRQRLNDESEHYYCEASGKMMKALGRFGIRQVPLDEVRQTLKGKEIKPTGEFSYTRKIKGHMIEKTMFGYPNVGSAKTSKKAEDLGQNPHKEFAASIPLDLEQALVVIRDWYYGSYMTKRTALPQVAEAFKKFRSHYEAKQLFRFCTLPLSQIQMIHDADEIYVRTAPGARDVQSWTNTEEEAKRFGNRNSNDSDTVPVIVAATMSSDEILAETIQLFRDVMNKLGRDALQDYPSEKVFDKGVPATWDMDSDGEPTWDRIIEVIVETFGDEQEWVVQLDGKVKADAVLIGTLVTPGKGYRKTWEPVQHSSKLLNPPTTLETDV